MSTEPKKLRKKLKEVVKKVSEEQLKHPLAVPPNDPLETFWLPYQVRWLNDNTQIKFAEKSRRIGWTYMQAYEDVRDCVLKKYFRPRRPLSVWMTSADITAAKEYIVYCREFAELFNQVIEDLGEEIIDPAKDIKALGLQFKNGARIFALSSNPSQFRSKGGKVVIDEYAHHKDQLEMWKAAYASAKMWGYPIRVFSTHNGKGTQFYKFVEKIKRGKMTAALHTVPIQLAVSEGLFH
jgi:phage FluMu gp28-like protein